VAVGESQQRQLADTNRSGRCSHQRRRHDPDDNPFSTATGVNRSIWAMGLRNPFTFAFQPLSGRMFINDVGEITWEEINEGVARANYGWPLTEGPTADVRFNTPLFAYNHQSGCAITGGTFYNPLTGQFPAQFAGSFFFADYCGGWIANRNAAGVVTPFATGIGAPVDLKVGDDGSLYYLARGGGSTTGTVLRITYGAAAPSITTHPSDQSASPGGSATFTVAASGTPPLRYQWQRNGANISGATSTTYTLSPVQASDDNAEFVAVVTNSFGTATSQIAHLTVFNTAPTATIVQPVVGTTYAGGSFIIYSGTGRTPRTAHCRPAHSRGAWTSTTTRTRIRSSRTRAASRAERSRSRRPARRRPTSGIAFTSP
jgi:hypothetical protein